MASLAFEKRQDGDAALDVLKGLLFLAFAVGFEWVVRGPLLHRYYEMVDRLFAPVFGRYGGFSLLSTFLICGFIVILTWIFLSVMDHRRLSDIGFAAPESPWIWRGLLAGFVPGLMIAFVVVAIRSWETDSNPVDVARRIPVALAGSISSSLVICGYGLQVLWRRIGGVGAVAIVALLSIIPQAVNYRHEFPLLLLLLDLLKESAECVLIGWAFSLTRNAWLPLGISLGLWLTPAGGALISWSTRSHWDSVWNVYFGFPALAATAGLLLVLWLVTKGAVSFAPGSFTDFYTASWAVGSGIALLLTVELWVNLLVTGRYGYDYGSSQATGRLIVLGLAAAFGAVVFLIWLYKSWAAIQDPMTRTTPGQAIGFLFIPFFNFYWIFRAFRGFAKEYNAYAQRNGLRVPILASGLYTAYAVLALLSIIPVIGLLPTLAAFIVGMVMMLRTRSAVNQLSLARTASKALGRICGVTAEVFNRLFEIPAAGIVIGSAPASCHAVVALPNVGPMHAQLWADPRGPGIWVQDMGSGGGTFWSPAGVVEWMRVTQPTFLAPGARLRLGASAAEFEIS